MSVQIHKVEVESKIETNLVSLPFRTFLVVTWKRIMHVDLKPKNTEIFTGRPLISDP